jgi:cephalosporin-C deacetylase
MIEHDFDFDPSCGYSKDELLKISSPETEPEDYESFWRDTFSESEKIPLDLKKRSLWTPEKDIDIYEIFFKSWDGFRTSVCCSSGTVCHCTFT